MNVLTIVLLAICIFAFYAIIHIAIQLIFMPKQICPKCNEVLKSINKKDPLEPQVVKPYRFRIFPSLWQPTIEWKVNFYYWCPKCGKRKINKT